MKMFRRHKTGDRTSPQFEDEPDFFVHLDVVLLKIEKWSNKNERMEMIATGYSKENREKWK